MADTLDDLLEQWRIHGGWKPSKADFQRLVDEVERLRTVAREVALSGVEDIDPRLWYVNVQVDRGEWEAFRAAVSPEAPPSSPESAPEAQSAPVVPDGGPCPTCGATW